MYYTPGLMQVHDEFCSSLRGRLFLPHSCFTVAEIKVASSQVLKKGGAFHCLEFSQLALPGLRELYDAYSFQVIPQIGR